MWVTSARLRPGEDGYGGVTETSSGMYFACASEVPTSISDVSAPFEDRFRRRHVRPGAAGRERPRRGQIP
jgi:hypothetical protein